MFPRAPPESQLQEVQTIDELPMENEKSQMLSRVQLPIWLGPSGVAWNRNRPGPEIVKSPLKQQFPPGCPSTAPPEMEILVPEATPPMRQKTETAKIPLLRMFMVENLAGRNPGQLP